MGASHLGIGFRQGGLAGRPPHGTGGNGGSGGATVLLDPDATPLADPDGTLLTEAN